MVVKSLEQLNREFMTDIQVDIIGSSHEPTAVKEHPAPERKLTEPSAPEQLVKEQQAPERKAKERIKKERQVKERIKKERPVKEHITKERQSKENQAKEHPAPKHAQERSVLKELGSLGIKIMIIVGMAAAIFTFVYGFHYNTDPDMSPAVKDGNLVLYYRCDKSYHSGDLILLTFQGNNQVRRVVAIAGDTVDITEEGLIVNGALQQEPDIYQITERYADGIEFPITLEEGQIFVLGDAREGATDSRVYGAVNVDDTHGTVITILRRRNL